MANKGKERANTRLKINARETGKARRLIWTSATLYPYRQKQYRGVLVE
jgi:hypothetical protein